MSTQFFARDGEGLATLLENLARVLQVEIKGEKVLMLTVEKDETADVLGKILAQSGLQVGQGMGTAGAKGTERIDVNSAHIRMICLHCREPFEARRKGQAYCPKKECQVARKKAYMQAWAKKEGGVEAEKQTPFGSEAEEDLREEDPRWGE